MAQYDFAVSEENRRVRKLVVQQSRIAVAISIYLLNFLIASALTGVKKLIKFPSGSRNSKERFPHGMVVGSWTTSLFSSFSYSLSTSSTSSSRRGRGDIAGCD